MPKALRLVVALSVVVFLFVALAGLVAESPSVAQVEATADGSVSVQTQVGDPQALDPFTRLPPEDPPYTKSEPIFNPQLLQAPVKDSVTWNPLFMSEFETLDGNQALGLYKQIHAGTTNATEKVWFRMWYEPWHWDKDVNANGVLDLHPTAQMPYTQSKGTRYDEWYPAVMQEFTYMLMEPKLVSQKPEPLAGPVDHSLGGTSFVFPVGIRQDQLTSPIGEGLTNLDADDDGVPDIVHVESELTLFDLTKIAADFNGNSRIDPLDRDTIELNGNELVIFRLDSKALYQGSRVRFLDYWMMVDAVYERSADIRVWYTGDTITDLMTGYRTKTIGVGDMLLCGRVGPLQQIRAVANGGSGTNMCDFPTGPFFIYLENIDAAEGRARLIVGRALGATWSGMEDSPGQPDLRQGDPWFLKRFYVDGHEYNVVAIKTENGAGVGIDRQCTLDADGDRVIDSDLWPPPVDPTRFKFITIRTPVPKTSSYEDIGGGYVIDQHSVRLQSYAAGQHLSVMPPYNYPHYILLDIQAITDSFTCSEEDVQYLGPLVEAPPVEYSYVAEDKNWQFLGELKEKYGDHAQDEFWYVEQFHTLPWEYTEFVLPDVRPDRTDDLYLVTSAFLAPQSEAVLWTQDVSANTTLAYHLHWDAQKQCWVRDASVNTMPQGWKPRLKFWFDPADSGRNWKYKTNYERGGGLRLYGFRNEGPGDKGVVDPGSRTLTPSYPVEVLPYTNSWAPFNPQLPQAPPKDSLTFNPAYMDRYNYSEGDELVSLYRQLSIREHDAREKVFLRMWYEPEYLDKILRVSSSAPYVPTQVYTFPALMQEFTYMYLDTRDQPASAQPGSSSFAFPIATNLTQLPMPDPTTGDLPPPLLPSFGYGLTTFDANFDGFPEAVQIHSEKSLATLTHIYADFNGDGLIGMLDKDDTVLNGNEMLIFALESIRLQRGQSVQLLDHMITLDNISPGTAELQFWYTGGGLHALGGGQYSLHPDKIGSPVTLRTGQMAIADGTRRLVRVLPASGNLGRTDGAWFVFVNDVYSEPWTSPAEEYVSVIIGRALGCTHSAMDNARGGHDLQPGDPWYLKRFFVDGHEYNVVAIYTARARQTNPGDETYEFKYITIRTPVPKVNFVNYEDSQKLEGYYPITGPVVSVLPPFNYAHTEVEDIQAFPEKESEVFVFGNALFQDEDCRGGLFPGAIPPYEIRILYEDREPQFFGELKEKYNDDTRRELWQTEQWHTLPDQYTELQLPIIQQPEGWQYLYLLTSDWESEQSRVYYYGCPDYSQNQLHAWNMAIPATNMVITGTGQTFFNASVWQRLRVKFLYDPTDQDDIYVNRLDGYNTLRVYGSGIHSVRTWGVPAPTPTPTPTRTPTLTPTPTLVPGPTGSISGTVRLYARTNHSGAIVSAGSVSAVTGSDGRFVLSGVPVGTYSVMAAMPGYLYALEPGVVVTAGMTTPLRTVQLLGGDACGPGEIPPDCVVNLYDMVFIARRYGTCPPSDPRADINANGQVDIFDLVAAGWAYGKSCPQPWVSPPSGASLAAALATLFVSPAYQSGLEVDDLLTVTLELQDVHNLYGVDAQLEFNPDVLEVVDSDPFKEGVQITRGTFPDPAQGAVSAEEADNTEGLVRYAISLADPAPPAEGSGTLCSITFRAKAHGYSRLHPSSVQLVEATSGASMPVVAVGGSVYVGPTNMLYLPLVLKSGVPR
nr:carboxypeptidase regulatory-like domain-containing protein [Chloroflexota bacterium]